MGLIIVAPQFVCQLAPSGPGADLSSSHLIISSIECLLGGKKVLRVPRRYDNPSVDSVRQIAEPIAAAIVMVNNHVWQVRSWPSMIVRNLGQSCYRT